jgi:hypothetical protein
MRAINVYFQKGYGIVIFIVYKIQKVTINCFLDVFSFPSRQYDVKETERNRGPVMLVNSVTRFLKYSWRTVFYTHTKLI